MYVCVYVCVCTHDDARAFMGVRVVCVRVLHTYTDGVLYEKTRGKWMTARRMDG